VPASTRANAGLCFSRPRPASAIAPVPLDSIAIPADVAQALADTLPFLLCGEESAVHAFGRRWAGHTGSAAALQAIADDEIRHAAWLERLAADLPALTSAPDPERMAGFFRRLLTRDPARHFAHIAALDLAVCDILRPLTASEGALTSAPLVMAGLRGIRQDEARHVRVARDCARAFGFDAARLREAEAEIRQSLAGLLAPVRGSLALLGARAFAAVELPTAAHA
jgi:hypothetical protein